jgi:hypothetical protein
LSPVNSGKNFVVGDIGPRLEIKKDKLTKTLFNKNNIARRPAEEPFGRIIVLCFFTRADSSKKW